MNRFADIRRRRPRLLLALVVLVMVLLVVVVAAFRAAQADDACDPAARAFDEGRYEDAVDEYRHALAESGYSAPRLFNLGNAYFRAGEVGRAISSYERARILDPRDPDIAENLAVVRHRAGLAAPGAPWWKRAAAWFSLDEWARIGAGALLLLALFLLYRGVFPALSRRMAALRDPSPRLFRSVTLTLAVVVVVSAVAIGLGVSDLDRAVVVDGAVVLRISPFEAAEATTSLPEGSLVEVERAFDDHVHVQAGDGRSGWAPAAQIEPILPAPGP